MGIEPAENKIIELKKQNKKLKKKLDEKKDSSDISSQDIDDDKPQLKEAKK